MLLVAAGAAGYWEFLKKLRCFAFQWRGKIEWVWEKWVKMLSCVDEINVVFNRNNYIYRNVRPGAHT